MTKGSILPIWLSIFALAAVIGFAMYRDPTFDLKVWQPILAAFVALGAAALAYSGAMAKVRLDERTASQNEYRKILGIFLRFDFAVDVLKYEAEYLAGLTDQPASPGENNIVTVDDLAFSEMPEIKEAWRNLDYFPVQLSRAFYSIQNALYNFATFTKDHAGEAYRCEYGMSRPEELDELRGIVSDLQQHCTVALTQVRAENDKLRARIV
ncbi:MAG TPA: hypothetical protein VGI20_06350 [Rhizomicrobium sp.]|jgi:hypothetical protein